MTEKEKMQKGMLYDANYDKTLLDERVKAKGLCYDFKRKAVLPLCKKQYYENVISI